MRKSKYEDIGKNGTADECLEAFKKAAGASSGGWSGSVPYQKASTLIEGAAEEFLREGHPEKIQILLQNLYNIEFGKALSGTDYYRPIFAANMLSQMSEKSDDKRAVIDLAFAKTSERDKKEILDAVLKRVVGYNYNNYSESFIAALLQAGADANAGQGFALATAITNSSPSIVKLLHENGASFDEAFVVMYKNNYGKDNIDKLKFYQETIAGKTGAAEAPSPVMEEAMLKVLETVQQIQEQVGDLAAQVNDLAQKVDNLPSSKPAPQGNGPAKKDYLKLKGPKSN